MRAYLKTLIKKGPVPLVKWGQVLYNLLPPSVRYGKAWNEAVALLMESEHWDEKALVKYQEERGWKVSYITAMKMSLIIGRFSGNMT